MRVRAVFVCACVADHSTAPFPHGKKKKPQGHSPKNLEEDVRRTSSCAAAGENSVVKTEERREKTKRNNRDDGASSCALSLSLSLTVSLSRRIKRRQCVYARSPRCALFSKRGQRPLSATCHPPDLTFVLELLFFIFFCSCCILLSRMSLHSK